jgi:hypothetical protein
MFPFIALSLAVYQGSAGCDVTKVTRRESFSPLASLHSSCDSFDLGMTAHGESETGLAAARMTAIDLNSDVVLDPIKGAV